MIISTAGVLLLTDSNISIERSSGSDIRYFPFDISIEHIESISRAKNKTLGP